MKAKKTFLALVLSGAAVLAGCGDSNPPSGGGGNDNPAPAVSSISPSSRAVGNGDFILTVTGSGFISSSVVLWNGSTRTTSFSSATLLTATVTASDLAFSGSAQVSVSTPAPGGGNSSAVTFTITPQISNGNGLPGDSNSPAIDATSNLRAASANAADVEDNVIMNRLNLRFARNATVGQVNDALASIGSGIVGMSNGIPQVSIGIPRQNSRAALHALATHLERLSGIRLATIAAVPQPQAMFNGSGISAAQAIVQMLPTRFPAAWNAARTDVFGDPSHPQPQLCPVPPIPVIMHDFFPPEFEDGFVSSFPTFVAPDAPVPGFPDAELQHGVITTTLMGANAIGANAFPFSGCIDLRLVQLAAFLDASSTIDDLFLHMPEGRFIVNYSAGFKQSCSGSPCQPPFDTLLDPLFFANTALYWKEMTQRRWPDFLMVVAAGNDRDDESAKIYPGMGDSRFESAMTISQLADVGFQFVAEDSLWSPSPEFLAQGFDSLKPTADEQAQLQQAIADDDLSGLDAIADNVIVVGSVNGQDPQSLLTLHVPGDQLPESAFSETSPDVLAVGQNLMNTGIDGTSGAAPQVAGLASFLWMLSTDLRESQPIAITKRAIVANARNKVIDAYASVLSLDEATLPTPASAPIRTILLDADGSSDFKEGDIDFLLRSFFVVDPQGNITDQEVAPTEADFSPFDLNGDGFTGGRTTERFDLDREGSTQYGESHYSTFLKNIDGADVAFNENQLTDLQILCYYAYSDLFTGNPAARDRMLRGRCTPITVTVDPAQADLKTRHTAQFGATVHGTSDPRVTWTATGNNTIDNNGLFTAGDTAGTFTVRAVSVVDPNAFGEATVRVSAGCSTGNNSNFLRYLLADTETLIQPDPDNTASQLSDSLSDSDSSASVTVRYGSIQTAARGDVLHAVNSNGNGTHDGGAQSLGEFEDAFTIVPDDPALQGSRANATISFRVTASPHVSGDRADSRWFVNSGFPFTFSAFGTLSTVDGKSAGDITGGTYSVSGPAFLGFDTVIDLFLLADVHYECGDQPCEQQQGLTGAGDTTVKFQWLGMTVKDQSGNPVPFTVCSDTGTDWAVAQ